MSCNFDVKKCLNCGKYNGCLLQTIHTNTNSLTRVVSTIIDNQRIINDSLLSLSKTTITPDESVNVQTDIEDINKNINRLTNIMNAYDMDRDELNIDISQIKQALTTLELKVDNMMKSISYNLV
jgi:hypothetical protein